MFSILWRGYLYALFVFDELRALFADSSFHEKTYRQKKFMEESTIRERQ